MPAAMSKKTQSLFETEMRRQVGNAETELAHAVASGDTVLVEVAESHLDGLLALAHRNGLQLSAGTTHPS
jgi:hypothetical protein